MKRHEGQEAEVSGLCSAICGFVFLAGCFFQTVPCLEKVSREHCLGKGLIVDLDPLADEAEMGRCVEADLVE